MTIPIAQAAYDAALAVFDAALGDMANYTKYGRPSYREGAVRTIASTIQECMTAQIERDAGIAEAFNFTPAFDQPVTAFERTAKIAKAIRDQSNG